MLYVYAITRTPATPDAEAVDQSRHFGAVTAGPLCAIYSPVASEDFSQEAIDARGSDLEWLGAIGYRHQSVVADVMRQTAVVPLRAFTLFSSETALREYLLENAASLSATLDRLDGKREWTLRLEFDAERWSNSLEHRVESLRNIAAEIETASAGKAFLLRKKLEEERKKASREAEQQLLAEVEQAVVGRFACEAVAETRQQRDGAFPQIDVLIDRDEDAKLQELHDELTERYAKDGVTLGITGPWPPYTFAALSKE